MNLFGLPMQLPSPLDEMDSVTVDLGYVTNGGFTCLQGKHSERDDRFTLEVKVKVTGHTLNTPGSVHELFAAVKFGDVIIVGERLTGVK